MPANHPSSEVNAAVESSPGKQGPRKRTRLLVLLPLVIVALLVAWQLLGTGTSSNDPRVAGRPLSNPQMHLHTVALGGKPGVMYLGTHFGLFTSIDNGHSWPQARGVLNSLMITVIAVNARDPSSLALVGIPSTSGSAQAGMYFSQDNGATWNLRRPPTLPSSAYPFTIHTGVAGSGHFYAFYLYAGWFETRDAGLHWKAINGDLPASSQNTVMLTFPGEPEHLLVGGDAGLFESKDDGTHWTQLAAVHGTVQALTASSQQPATIFCSTDQGLFQWHPSTSPVAGQAVQMSAGSPATFGRIVTDSSGRRLYGLAGNDLWFSTDGGAHWTRHHHFERGDVVALLLDPLHASRVYVGFFLPPKVVVSEDDGSSWQVLTQ